MEVHTLKADYYKEKMNGGPDAHLAMTRYYLKSMSWMLQYYYGNLPSWDWYYPYQYGPLPSDFSSTTVVESNFKFTLGTPLKPLEQLLSVCRPPLLIYYPKLMAH